jgi:UV DNA damage repair endonuclease
MKKIEFGLLAIRIEAAKRIGQEAADAVDDAGSCNLDTLILNIPRLRADWFESYGIRVYRLGSYIAVSTYFGMANKQQRGVEAMAKHLQSFGYPASVWYQMD